MLTNPFQQFMKAVMSSDGAFALCGSLATIVLAAVQFSGATVAEALAFGHEFLLTLGIAIDVAPDVVSAWCAIGAWLFGIAGTTIVGLWCAEAWSTGEVRPLVVPSRRATVVMVAIASWGSTPMLFAALTLVACVGPAVAAYWRYGQEDGVLVLAMRMWDVLVAALALVLYPILWLLKRR